MFLEVEIHSVFGSIPKPDERDYEEIRKIIERQIKAETCWEVWTKINKDEDIE